MPIGWCCPPAIRRQVRSRARKPCRASRRLLLSGRPRAASLTLANRFQGGDPIDHVDVRHHEIKPDHWPRGGAAPCNARLSRRQVRYLEWLSGLLGLILTGRGRCGTLRRVRHSSRRNFESESFGASMTNFQAASIVGEIELRWRDMLIDLYTPYWTDKTPIEQRRINGPQ